MTACQVARGERGFALVAVTLVLAVLGVVVAEFAFATRLETSMVRAYKEAILARNLAEAGVEQAIREMLTDASLTGVDEAGQAVFYRVAQAGATPQRLPALPRHRVGLGAGEFSYRLTDEEARLNVNSGPERLARLLQTLGVDQSGRDTIVSSVEDWRDSNDLYRTGGAESEDTYLRLPLPYRARNGNLQDQAELLQIKGVSPELYYGAADRRGLADLVTTRGRGLVNINTAPPEVLAALGLSEAEANDIIQARAGGPYTVVPGRFGARRLAVTSATFRIEAEGWIGGRPRTRILTIVQRTGGGAATPSVITYAWRVLPPRGLEPSEGTQR